MQRVTHQRGATVVELLVYLFLFVLLSGGSLTLLFSLDNLFTQYRAKQLLFNSGTAIMERVLTEAREADEVIVGSSVIASTTAATLALDYAGETRSVVWTAGQVELRYPTSSLALHNPAVTVTGLRFYYYESDGHELVRVAIDLSTTINNYTETLTLEGGAIVRGSYVQS